jgi:predicted metal-dependent hydrolase
VAEPLQIFQETYRELRPRAAIPEFKIEFFPFANINNTIRLRDERVQVRISDLLEAAPEPVLRAIAHILLAKLYRRAIDPAHAACYRRHVGSRSISEKAHLVRQSRGRKRIQTAQGQFYNLEQIFEELNQTYFHGLLGRPTMTWSTAESRSSLGHYDPAHNTIVISRIFDDSRMPRFVLEYLVYHEMLHLKYPVRLRGSRRCVHPPTFQAEEGRFPRFEEAKRFLRGL